MQGYAGLFNDVSIGVIRRTALTAVTVTLICAAIAFPLAYYMARYAGPKAKPSPTIQLSVALV